LKWLGAVFDCSLYYTRDPDHLVRVMSTNPSYLRTTADGKGKNYRDWGIALGRRFRALNLWCLIRSEGVAGLQARLRRDIANAKWLAEQVTATPHWRVVAPYPLQTVCVVHEPPGLTGEALDGHTRAWAERVNRSGRAYLTPAILGGRWVVRVSVGAEQTTRADVEAVWALMRTAAEACPRRGTRPVAENTPPAAALRSVHTANFAGLLTQLNISLVVTTYQAGKLVLLRADGGRVNTHFRTFAKPMGVAVAGSRLAVGTATEIWEYHDHPAGASPLEP